MSRRNPNQGPNVARHALGVAMAGGLAVLAVVVAAKKGNNVNVDSGAALQHALRPTMTRTAGDIIGFADKHPSLSKVKIGKRVVDVTVRADVTPPEAKAEGGRPDTASMEVVTRRQPGSDEPDPNAVLSVSVDRSGHVNGDPAQNYDESIRIQSPAADDGEWRGEGEIKVGDGPAQFHADTANSAHPVRDALGVAAQTEGILQQTEFDLDPNP